MKKVLFVASVSDHIIAFHTPFLEMFKKNGYVTEVASNGEKKIAFCDVHYDVKFARNPLKKNNIKAYKQLKRIINDGEYDIVHCHTPVAAMLTRLSSRKARKRGTKVVYTAHGFHFYKGAPFLNWLVYFPVEWVCSFFTDTLILINKEDYAFAKKHMHAKNIEYVPGVGVDSSRFANITVDNTEKRKELGIPENATVVMSVGELNTNKNHEVIIRAVAEIKDVYYIVAGKGALKEFLENLTKEFGVEERVKILGFRKDIGELLNCVDIFAFPSYREGLPVSLMEAMCVGLPVVASDIRGVRDLIKDGENGFLCNPFDYGTFADKIRILSEDSELREKMGKVSKEKIEGFSMETVNKTMRDIYGL